MDTSQEYIKMCEKAYPDLGKPQMLELPNLWTKGYDDFHQLLSKDGDDEYWSLYRQDQLQAMVKGEWTIHKEKDGCMPFTVSFDADPDLAIRCQAPTAEQALLEFVMFKLHRKKEEI